MYHHPIVNFSSFQSKLKSQIALLRLIIAFCDAFDRTPDHPPTQLTLDDVMAWLNKSEITELAVDANIDIYTTQLKVSAAVKYGPRWEMPEGNNVAYQLSWNNAQFDSANALIITFTYANDESDYQNAENLQLIKQRNQIKLENLQKFAALDETTDNALFEKLRQSLVAVVEANRQIGRLVQECAEIPKMLIDGVELIENHFAIYPEDLIGMTVEDPQPQPPDAQDESE